MTASRLSPLHELILHEETVCTSCRMAPFILTAFSDDIPVKMKGFKLTACSLTGNLSNDICSMSLRVGFVKPALRRRWRSLRNNAVLRPSPHWTHLPASRSRSRSAMRSCKILMRSRTSSLVIVRSGVVSASTCACGLTPSAELRARKWSKVLRGA